MKNTFLNFSNKKDEEDFYIALVVIAVFALFLGWIMGWWKSDKLETNINPDNFNGITEKAILIGEHDTIDTDGDGVPDASDRCPQTAGLISFNGCPNALDSDGDGVADENDKCIDEIGLAINGGCPADSDGDGVLDRLDKCPYDKGFKKLNGCPLPDGDEDGIPDAVDKCPTIAGIRKNGGCPPMLYLAAEEEAMIEEAIQGVEFKFGSAELTPESSTLLDNIVKLAYKYPEAQLHIDGHTDSTGDDALNLQLSKDRATSCYAYLIKKGIMGNRMHHEGYGETQPIADNKTKEGRQKNRRVDFDLNY